MLCCWWRGHRHQCGSHCRFHTCCKFRNSWIFGQRICDRNWCCSLRLVYSGACLTWYNPQKLGQTLGIGQQVHIVGNHWWWGLAVGGWDCVRGHTQGHAQTGYLEQFRVWVGLDPRVTGWLRVVDQALEDIYNLRLGQEGYFTCSWLSLSCQKNHQGSLKHFYHGIKKKIMKEFFHLWNRSMKIGMMMYECISSFRILTTILLGYYQHFIFHSIDYFANTKNHFSWLYFVP